MQRRFQLPVPPVPQRLASLLLGILLLAIPGSLRADPDAPPLPQFVEAGRELFLEHCAVCHGTDARGDGVAAEALRKPPADLTRIAERREGVFPAGEIATWIDGRFENPAHGSREMPIWGRALRDTEPRAPGLEQELVRGKIDMLVDYLRTLQTRGSVP